MTRQTIFIAIAQLLATSLWFSANVAGGSAEYLGALTTAVQTGFIFGTLLFSLLYISTQLTGQVVLALSMIGMLSWLEIVDTLKDGEELKRVGSKGENVPGGTGDTPSQTDRPLTFSETIPLSLLGCSLPSTTHLLLDCEIPFGNPFIRLANLFAAHGSILVISMLFSLNLIREEANPLPHPPLMVLVTLSLTMGSLI